MWKTMKTILLWALVAAVVMVIFPIKFLGVWLSMIFFPFVAVRQLDLSGRENPTVAGLGYGALTGAIARFFVAVFYLLIGSLAAAGADTSTETGATMALAGSLTAFSGLVGLFTGPIVGAIVGGLSGMVAAATAPKKLQGGGSGGS